MFSLLLSSSVLILLLVALRSILQGRISARLQYALWLLVLVRLLVPISFFRSPISVAETVAPAVMRVEDVSYRPVVYRYTYDGSGSPVQADEEETIKIRKPAPKWTVRDVIRVVWFCGSAVMTSWFLVVNRRLSSWLRKVRVPYGRESVVPVYMADGIPSPCLFGLFRPAVYLTPHAAEDDRRARQIIAHELTHFRHGDVFWAFMRSVCLVVWWFDPLVWLAAALSRQDAELACDEGTIKALGEEARFDYGRTLVDMAKVGVTPSDLLCGATTMTSGRKTLKQRIERIAQASKVSAVAVTAALLAAALAVGCTYSGALNEAKNASVSGADVFRRYYSQSAEADTVHDYSHMDLDALDGISLGTVGQTVDTDELTIEPTGVIVSGNTAQIVLRITAKKLETVLRDTAGAGMNTNYQFGDETALFGAFTLNRNYYYLSHHYYYSDSNEALAPNQFELRYWIILPEPFDMKPYEVPYWAEAPGSSDAKPFIIPLANFGYYDQGVFVPLYDGDRENEGDWNVEIPLDPSPDTWKHLAVDHEINVGEFRFAVRDIQLTPLACTIRLSCLEEDSLIRDRSGDIYKSLFGASSEAALVLSDGTILTGDSFEASGGGSGWDYFVTLSFYGPISTDGISSLLLFGDVFGLDSASPEQAVPSPLSAFQTFAHVFQDSGANGSETTLIPSKYEEAGAQSVKDPVEIPLQDLPGNTFVLSESYYDGETLLLAYELDTMKYPVQFGFGPKDENYDHLWLTGQWYIDAQWEKMVFAEDYERICRELRDEDQTGFMIRSAYLGDHILLADGTDLGPMLSTELENGTVVLECQEGLPESARNKSELKLEFKVREILTCYYKNGESFYRYVLNLNETTVEVSVPAIRG